MQKNTRLKSLSALAVGLCAAPVAALAGTPRSEVVTTPPPASPWEFRIEPYAWLTGLDGTIGVRDLTSDVNVPASDVLSHLDMAAALQFEARNGRWGFIADGFYAKLSASGSAPTPREHSADIELKQFIGELYAAYRVADGPCGFLDAYAGLRYNYLSLDLSAKGPRRSISASGSENWTDPIVGLRGQWNLNEKFYLAAKTDIGGCSSGSDLAWSIQATLGYNFTKSVSAELGYRYLHTDYSNGGFTYDMAQDGLLLGVNIRF